MDIETSTPGRAPSRPGPRVRRLRTLGFPGPRNQRVVVIPTPPQRSWQSVLPSRWMAGPAMPPRRDEPGETCEGCRACSHPRNAAGSGSDTARPRSPGRPSRDAGHAARQPQSACVAPSGRVQPRVAACRRPEGSNSIARRHRRCLWWRRPGPVPATPNSKVVDHVKYAPDGRRAPARSREPLGSVIRNRPRIPFPV